MKINEIKPSKSLPFWSWNSKLDKKELERQIDWMKEKDFGGFFMHARSGLKTEYLSKEWFDCVKTCIDKAKEVGLEPWAYDENGWPSGFVGGELLKDKNNRENYLSCTVGEYDKNSAVSFDLDKEKLTVTTHGKNCLNIYINISPSTVDILDDKVVDEFIEKTHEQYKKNLGEKFKDLQGFFTDEPQYYEAAIPFPHLIGKYFKEKYNENVLDGIGLLFVEKDGYRAFRYKYWSACQDLMLNNFAKKYYSWCEDNGVKLTGHYIEERDMSSQMLCNAGIMPFYKYEHMVGIDWLCRRFMSVVLARQVGSVCAQYGKKDAITESFAMTGWDVTPKELKAIAEFQHLYGINRVCQHLLPYSEVGERKRDYPCHFSWVNPWVREGMEEFNGYLNTLGGLMRDSVEPVNVAILHPIRSAYLYYKYGNSSTVKDLDFEFIRLSTTLARKGIAFHYLDETLLREDGFVNGNKIGCGKCDYKYLIIPKCYTMDKTTEKLLREYIKNGGKVFLYSGKPTYLEGEKYNYEYLESNTTIEEINADQPYKIECYNDKLFPVYKKWGGTDFIMLVNIDGKSKAEGKISVDGKLTVLDLITGKRTPSDGTFSIEPMGSLIFTVNDYEKIDENKVPDETYLLQNAKFKVIGVDDNAFVLDFTRYSFDGIEYSQKVAVCCVFDKLLKMRYDGDIYLKFEFDVRDYKGRINLMSEYSNAEITVNGNKIVCDKPSKFDKDMKLGDISKYIINGKNEIIIKQKFFEKPDVYYALFGDEVTEGLVNCLVYDTYLENLYLFGDFGVYSDQPFIPGSTANVRLGQNFYISNKKEYISEMISDGYPFFAGNIKLKAEIEIDNPDVLLKIDGRIHYADVSLNGVQLGKCMLKDIFDVSRIANIGKNEIIINLSTGNRNLFGPHHDVRYEENTWVSPFSFDMRKTWENDESPAFRNCYSLMRQGIFKPDREEW